MLITSLLFLFNMARGQAEIKHWQWLALATWIIYSYSLSWRFTALWMAIVVVVTILPTKKLLDGINGDRKAIVNGFIRNLPIVPVLYILGNWYGLILLMQGLVYYLCGKWQDRRATRLAEGITGVMIGLAISV